MAACTILSGYSIRPGCSRVIGLAICDLQLSQTEESLRQERIFINKINLVSGRGVVEWGGVTRLRDSRYGGAGGEMNAAALPFVAKLFWC